MGSVGYPRRAKSLLKSPSKPAGKAGLAGETAEERLQLRSQLEATKAEIRLLSQENESLANLVERWERRAEYMKARAHRLGEENDRLHADNVRLSERLVEIATQPPPPPPDITPIL